MLNPLYKKIFIPVFLLIILVGIIIWRIPDKESLEEQVSETPEELNLKILYEECKKIDNPLCAAVASENEEKCNTIKDEMYKEYYGFIENYPGEELELFEKEAIHCKNYIKMKNIFLEGGDCTEITEIDKEVCEEMLVLKELNDDEFSSYCETDCSITYYFAGALRTKNSNDCDKISEANQKNICKASVTNDPKACKELCDIAYNEKLTKLEIIG